LCVVEPLEARALLSAAVAMPAFQHVIIDNHQGQKRGPKGIADVNGDGLNDLIAFSPNEGTFWYRAPTWRRYRVSDQGGSGSGTGECGAVADVNGDGFPDFICAGLMWLENPRGYGDTPRHRWREHPIAPIDDHDIAPVDFDRDGRIDIAVVEGIEQQIGPDQWRLITNNRLPGRGPHGFGTAVGDINRDGWPDLISTTTDGNLAWWENPRNRHHPLNVHWRQHLIGPASSDGNSMTAADLNGDGRLDVAFDRPYGPLGLFWYQAPADPVNGHWIQRTIDTSVEFVHQGSIDIGDMNKDGTPDVVIAEQEQSDQKRVAIYYNNGKGTAWTQQVLATTGGMNAVVADIDNDGDLDILSANHGFFGAPNPLEIWRNQLNPQAKK
jgi:hypothetical protein